MSGETATAYRVLYIDADGHEQLTAAMPYDAAYARARQLEGRGFSVVSVMESGAAVAYMEDRYSPTYRGVKVPDGLRDDNQPYVLYEAWKRGVDSVLGVVVPLLDELHDDEPCVLDHHGYCQMHGLPQPGPCPDAVATEFIAAAAAGRSETS
ncbi:hypothetical protein [Streptomyces sp. NPDC001781]